MSVQQLIDDLADRLRRSVVLDDPEVRLLATSRHFGDEDEVRVRAVLQRDAGPDAVRHVLAQGVAGWTVPGVVPAAPEIGMRARVCVPVRDRGQLRGLLMVMDADGTLGPDELAATERVAAQLAPLLEATATASVLTAPVVEPGLLHDVLSPDPHVRLPALGRLEAEGTVPARDLTVLRVALDGDPGEGTARSRLRRAVARPAVDRAAVWQAGALDPADDRRAVLVVGTPSPWSADATGEAARRWAAYVAGSAADASRVRVGIGAGVPSLAEAHRSDAQARLALASTEVADPRRSGVVAHWAGLGVRAALLRVPAAERAEAVPDELRRLLAADVDGSLVTTVRAYLDHAGAGPATAAALHVHRTTLYYRLGRIAELTGLDLADGRTRLALHVGLELLDLPGADRPSTE
ncbi:MAG: helix-turn-helix domain-containing protein [Nocardioides alkalitolerans]